MTNRIYNWFKTKMGAICGWLRQLVTWPQPAKVTRPEPAKPVRPIVTRYFEEHPEAQDGVMKAAYAYHDDFWPDDSAPRHRFGGSERTAACLQCGRSREQVRWDELPPQCQNTEEDAAMTFAFPLNGPNDRRGQHHFSLPDFGWSCCMKCGRTRTDILDSNDMNDCPENQPWQSVPSFNAFYGFSGKAERIKEVLLREERMAFRLFKRAETDVPKLLAKMGMSGGTLAVLHHTHGFTPEIVEGITTVPPQVMADYHAVIEMEKARSRAAKKSIVVTVKGVAA